MFQRHFPMNILHIRYPIFREVPIVDIRQLSFYLLELYSFRRRFDLIVTIFADSQELNKENIVITKTFRVCKYLDISSEKDLHEALQYIARKLLFLPEDFDSDFDSDFDQDFDSDFDSDQDKDNPKTSFRGDPLRSKDINIVSFNHLIRYSYTKNFNLSFNKGKD